MSTMTVASGGLRSTLNPNAPLFIPSAFRQVEDFSPEWYELVKTSTWFREHWYHQQQVRETFDVPINMDDDVINMLPDSFDIGVEDELADLEYLDEAIFQQAFVSAEDPLSSAQTNKLRAGLDAGALLKNLNMKSPKNHGVKTLTDAAKYREKPIPAISPKPSPRRIIQQPR